MVRDIVVLGDVAYFGGAFTRHNGLDQVGLGAVLVSTGEPVAAFDTSVDDDDPLTSNEAVYSLATDGARLFVGGRFTSVDGQPRNHLASVTLATNSLDAWAPEMTCGGCNRAWDLLVDGSSVFMANRNAGAVTAHDKTTGVRRWRVTANGDAQALALADGVLYAGGHFTEFGNDDARLPRTLLAALDPATGAWDQDFQPDFAGSFPGIWALSATSNALYVGGHFRRAGAIQGNTPSSPCSARKRRRRRRNAADGVDNDGDTFIDFPADPGCTSDTDTTESPNPPPRGAVRRRGRQRR